MEGFSSQVPHSAISISSKSETLKVSDSVETKKDKEDPLPATEVHIQEFKTDNDEQRVSTSMFRKGKAKKGSPRVLG